VETHIIVFFICCQGQLHFCQESVEGWFRAASHVFTAWCYPEPWDTGLWLCRL